MNLPLNKCPSGSGIIESVITAKYLGDLDLDDTRSNMSGSTADNLSVVDSAEFDNIKSLKPKDNVILIHLNINDHMII